MDLEEKMKIIHFLIVQIDTLLTIFSDDNLKIADSKFRKSKYGSKQGLEYCLIKTLSRLLIPCFNGKST